MVFYINIGRQDEMGKRRKKENKDYSEVNFFCVCLYHHINLEIFFWWLNNQHQSYTTNDFLSLLIFDDYRDDCLLLFFISFLYKKMSNEKNPESMNSESSSIIIDNWRKRILLPIHLSECQLRHMNKGFSDS